MAAKLGRSTLARTRLRTQRILGSSLTDPADVVRSMLAMQAQDFGGAKWSVGLRAPGSTDVDVTRAIASGEIVRSWPMRGTLHFTAAEDLRWMLSITAARMIASAASRRANLGLDDRTLERAREIAVEHLTGRRTLTREQILAMFERAGISTAAQRGYHILWHLSQTGSLCFGAPQAKEQTFVLLDEWAPSPRRLERDEALGEFARRYFTSHGPATLQDFAWWAKLTARDAKTGFALARPALIELAALGESYWMAADAEPLVADAARAVKEVIALPGFDEYMLGYRDRGAVLDASFAERIVPGGNGMFMPTVVVDGEIVGTWRKQASAKRCVVEAAPFTRLSATAEKGFARAVEAYGHFLGIPTRAGAH